MRGERLLMIATPILAMTAVALGLRLGARGDDRAAVVYGAPASGAGTGLAWQVATFHEVAGAREPLALSDVEVVARAADREARWRGSTNDDGIAEVLLALPPAAVVDLEVRAGGAVLAGGRAEVASSEAGFPASAWAPFARREGRLALDVAVLGQRVASGFSATIWVRAADAATRAALVNVTIDPENDSSLSSSPGVITDERGWARVVATPMGHAVALVVHARAPDGRTGEWAGALLVSPGAPDLTANDRYGPDEQPSLDIVAPNLRSRAYVEIDDARGRAWGAAVALATEDGAMPHARVRAPRLAPGLYWAIASSDPMGAALLGPGTIARPFFVASSDEAALAFGTDAEACALPRDARDIARVLGACLARTRPIAHPRAVAIEGFSERHAVDRRRAAAGLSVALGAIGVAVVLEAILVLRAWHSARAQLRTASRGENESENESESESENESESESENESVRTERAWNVVVALLVALLGFGLLAALLIRAG
jgi:hypothetical protein